MTIKQFFKNATVLVGIFAFLPTLFVAAQTNPNGQNPGTGALPVATQNGTVTVTPAAARDSSSTPIYGINMTACLEVFNWSRYLADINNGITNSNPYDKKDCVKEDKLATNGSRTITRNAAGKITGVNYTIGNTAINKTLYNQFTIGQAATKTELGNLPVLGVFPNGSYSAQALNTYEIDGTLKQTVAPVNRADKSGLTTIFPENKLQLMYSTGGDRNGVPRTPYTGPSTFSGQNWMGGMCVVKNGRMVARTRTADPIGPYNGANFGAADYGLNVNDPITTCAWPNNAKSVAAKVYDEGVAKDNLLEVYQFIYKVPFPANYNECTAWFPGAFADYNACISWFRERYSKALTGQATGNALYYTYTYYGAWNDIYTQWVGWENPDINKARASFTTNASLAQLRTYFGDPEDALRRVYGDGVQPYNFTYQELVQRINTATPSLQSTYLEILKTRYESYIRGADGYSVYAI